MTSEYSIAEAAPSDADAIATLFSQTWTSPFTILQFGQMNPSSLAEAMAPRILEQMSKPHSKFLVARKSNNGQVIAVAQWSVPVNNGDGGTADNETPEQRDDRQRFEDETYRNKLPENSNKDLIMEFTAGLRQLRHQVLGRKKHYLLENLATHPDHRGRGLASQLIEWVFPHADKNRFLVYLDTASDNPAMRLYKRLGFVEKGSHTIDDLSRFGGEGSHTHVALIRDPKTGA
ncbi:acyl-CoA N-acyltransferase [Clohesyomyces aquaticus]|uniref:Acyl-CoA N-acyltransferase n=1 Tax=Clohesyomyces aquaticus TaxID=1231657 RepID=A0A1Y1YGG2_9PLEO|nr:acyl-CoA N-acyltransferase [Clohesyomyces aquaticus]